MKKSINTSVLKLHLFFVNVSLILFWTHFSFTQPSYNQCSQALEICPNSNNTITNIDANVTICAPCDDNFNICFTPNNTIWLKFTTNNTGGLTQINFSNLVFETAAGQDSEVQATIIKANAPCDGTTYSAQGNCVTNATTNFSLTANLLPNTQYFVVLNGAKNGAGINIAAEFTLDVSLTGAGVQRIIPNLNLEYPLNLCKNELANFVAHLTNCPDSLSYNWFINGVLVAVTQDSVFQTTAVRNGDIVTVSNTCFTQCVAIVSTDSPNMNVTEFLVDAGPDQSIDFGGSVELNGNTAGFSFVWSPDVNLSSSTVINPTVSPEQTTSYFLTGEQNGCFITDEVVVTVGLDLEIFNTFSPNDDGKNDTWEIPGLVNYPNCLVEIFDRWGQQVFTATGYNEKKSWNGLKDGKKLTPGTYFYHIELRDTDKTKLSGYVNLIR
ncbi:MAG: gliding motility-associated C-terminal domain-containing protein [Flavobacteriia bacterium]|jgi:gliding motility-associated-like protein